jgi:hypothetical protein
MNLTAKIFLYYKTKLSESWQVSNLEIHVDVYLRDQEILFFQCKHIIFINELQHK